MEACLEALPVLVIEWVGGSLEDDGLAVQHIVLSHHDLHESFAPTEVQERPPVNTHMKMTIGDMAFVACDTKPLLHSILKARTSHSEMLSAVNCMHVPIIACRMWHVRQVRAADCTQNDHQAVTCTGECHRGIWQLGTRARSR